MRHGDERDPRDGDGDALPAPAELRIGLLGAVEVHLGGDLVDVGGPQQRAVIAHLALDVGRVVPAERLIRRLWGEQPPASPLAALQACVSRLRRAVEPGRAAGAAAQVLVSEAPGYVLRIGRDQVDVARFQRLAADARDAAAHGHHEAALERFDLALAEWRGPALAGLGPVDEVGPIADRLDGERADVAEDRFDTLLALGRHSEAIGPLQDAVTDHPLRERLWAQLALALYRSRRQADALRALGTARTTLVEQLGLDPGPELRELEASILAQDPSLLAVASRAAVTPRPTLDDRVAAPVVVGRAGEWRQVRDALDAARHGPAGLLLIEGEPGIGKTTMLDALTADAAAAGWRVALGRCTEPGLSPSLWPWIEVVRAISADESDDLDGRGERSLASLLSGAAVEDATTLSTVELADRIAALLRHDTATAPRLVILDDLHWADAVSLALVPLVLDRSPDLPLLIAGGHRPAELAGDTPFSTALGLLARVPSLTRLALPGLDPDDVARLMTLVGGTEPSADVATRVQQRSGGNPLFVAELARLAGSSGVTDDEVVPDAVRDVVRRRLAQLPSATNDVLRVAAVLGQDVELRVLGEASGVGLDDCLDALDPAIVTRVLVPTTAGTYRFAHALVRDAVLADLSALRLARLHLRAADAIEHVHGLDLDHAEPIAWHRLAAAAIDDPATVTRTLTLAGDVARARSAFELSEELLGHALEVARRIPRGPQRIALEISALESLLSVETLRSFMGLHLDDLAARIDEVADRNDSAPMHQLANFTRWSAINSEGPVGTEPIVAAALELAERAGDPYTVALGHYMAGSQNWMSGRLAEGREHYRLAMAAQHAAATSDPPIHTPRTTVPGLAAIAAQVAGDDAAADELLPYQRELLAPRRDQGAEVDLAFSYAMVLGVRGDAAGTRDVTAFTVEERPRAWMPHFSPACRVLHSWAAVELGADAGRPAADLAVHLDVAWAAIAELEAGPTHIGLPAFRTFHAAALLRVGDPRALDELRRARDAAVATADRWWLPETLRLLAHAEERFGDPAVAPALLAQARDVAERQGAGVVLARLDAGE